jgi:hypothetical protein
MRASTITILSILVLISCSKDERDTANPTPAFQVPYEFVSYEVFPQATDGNITTGLSTQYAYLPKEATVRKNKLFVFLPGTFAKPQTYLKILQTASEYGYHAIGIHYQNTQDVGSYCGSTNDDQCDANVLKEFFTGIDHSPNVNVGQGDGFTNRIQKMILYLDAQKPNENWKQFLSGGNGVKWELISLAGHSQGSGHTFYISKQVNLLRASLFSGPNGFTLANGSYPSWVSNTGATPNSKVFGFSNKNDNLSQWNFVSNVWNTIGLAGKQINVDTQTDFGGSHQLFTEVVPPPTQGSASPTHGSTAVDIVTPLNPNGRPKFENVWKYMCFPE